MSFPCTSCGACCRRAVPEIDPSGVVQSKEDGSCVHLTEDNTCDIYETRPAICRSDFVRNILKMSEPEYNEKNADMCNAWIREDGMGEEFFVQLGG